MPRERLVHLSFAFLVALVVGVMLAPAQGQLTTLYTFAGNGLPQNPNSSAVAQGRDGNYYFTTCIAGGSLSELFNITPSGALTQVFTPPSNCVLGATLGADGNFYLAYNDFSCCGNTNGAIYKVSPSGGSTVLYTFTGGTDGSEPYAPPIQASNGRLYGTTTSQRVANDTAYTITPSGSLTTLHTFATTEAQNIYAPLLQGSDGNFYGISYIGGAGNLGSIFKMTPAGAVTVLHSFSGTDGQNGNQALMQASDGNFYGTTYGGGANNDGVLFKITSTGTYTKLYDFPSTFNYPYSGLIQASNGLLYGVTSFLGGPWHDGAIYSYNIATATLTTLYSFTGQSDGGQPIGPLVQMTNGLLYGTTYVGGGNCSTAEWDGEIVIVGGCGTVFSYNIASNPFIKLQTTSGQVGSSVGIFGQGFSSSSIVKFNGVQASSVKLAGSTYLVAVVPAGATDGFVTVTTGSTTLASTQKFIVHNSWASGLAMPTGTVYSSAAVLGGKIYVIGGDNASGTVLSTVQIYNPATNIWSVGTPLPAALDTASAAVVDNILYVFGGSPPGAPPTSAVWAFDPKTKVWTSMAPMPTPRNGTLAVVEKNIVYVIGGNLGGGPNFVPTVESYNPATNTWTEEAPMDGAKDYPGGGLIGTTIVVADGSPNGNVVTGDTEGYNAVTNSWSELTADPTPRTGPCSGVIGGTLFDASGYVNNAGAATTINESFSLSTNKWTTTLAPIPQGTMYPATVVDNGQLYCFGGWAVVNASAINNVQIYQP